MFGGKLDLKLMPQVSAKSITSTSQDLHIVGSELTCFQFCMSPGSLEALQIGVIAATAERQVAEHMFVMLGSTLELTTIPQEGAKTVN